MIPSKAYIAIKESQATDLDSVDSNNFFNQTDKTDSYTYDGSASGHIMCSIDTTKVTVEFIAKFNEIAEEYLSSYPFRQNAISFDLENVKNILAQSQKDTSVEPNLYYVSVPANFADGFRTAFSALTVSEFSVDPKEKLDGQAIVGFELNFSDEALTQPEKDALNQFMTDVKTALSVSSGHPTDVQIFEKYGPDMLELYLFAKENKVDEDAPPPPPPPAEPIPSDDGASNAHLAPSMQPPSAAVGKLQEESDDADAAVSTPKPKQPARLPDPRELQVLTEHSYEGIDYLESRWMGPYLDSVVETVAFSVTAMDVFLSAEGTISGEDSNTRISLDTFNALENESVSWTESLGAGLGPYQLTADYNTEEVRTFAADTKAHFKTNSYLYEFYKEVKIEGESTQLKIQAFLEIDEANNRALLDFEISERNNADSGTSVFTLHYDPDVYGDNHVEVDIPLYDGLSVPCYGFFANNPGATADSQEEIDQYLYMKLQEYGILDDFYDILVNQYSDLAKDKSEFVTNLFDSSQWGVSL